MKFRSCTPHDDTSTPISHVVLRVGFLIVLALGAVSCSDDSVGDADEPCGGTCGPAEECSNDRCVPLIDAGGDVGGSEDADTDGEDDTSGPSRFPYRAPCEVDSECRSGICLSTFDGDFCSRLCETSADCGVEDWDCFNLDPGSGERVDICAPRSNICSPCAVDINCSGGRCVQIEEGKFCMQDCREDLDCPDGFSCRQLVVEENGEQVSVNQCTPDDGFCGDCVDKDGDGYGEGDGCLGPDCDDSDPGVFPGQLDGCDGFNVDCDDETDEDILCTAAFSEENICVDGFCEVLTCEPGRADCNGVFSDGCEVDLSSQTSCGGCRGIDEDVDCNQLSIDTGEGYQCSAVEDGEPGEFECQKTGCLNGFGICESSANCVDLSLESSCGGGCTVCDEQQGVVDGFCKVLSEAPFTAACRPAEDGCAEGFCDLDSFDNDCESIRLTERCGASCDDTFVDCRNLPNTEGQTCDMETGQCQFESCRPGFADCNGLVEDGCEASTFDRRTCTSGCFDCNDFVEDSGGTYHVSEVQNCGADGCNYVCDAGWGDCPVDGPTSPRDFLDGCETSLNQRRTCGSCFNDCSRRYPNSTGSCGEGDTAGVDATGCGLGSCTGNYVDADLELENGCECLPSGYDEPDVDGMGGYVDLNCDRIDGELTDSTFVRDGGVGNCLTRNNACGSIQQAIRAAELNDRSWVLVSRGVYEENIDLASGVSIAGGYGPNWERGDHREPAFQTIITGEYRSDEDSYITMRGSNYEGNLRNIRVNAPVINEEDGPTNRANGDGYSTAAIVLTDGGESKWENLSIGLSNATNGTGGEDGSAGWSQPAPDGADGADADNRDGGSGGAETSYSCGGVSTAGGAGGSGGQGGILGVPGETGDAGSCGENNPASGNDCGVGDQAGQAGRGGDGDQSGQRGENGEIGDDGESGDGGSTTIIGLNPDDFRVSVEAATDGTVGSHGGGAGGGGGGGGSSRGLAGLSPTGGAGGGAGGAGGCAASSAGTAGRAGGHAIGVFTENVDVTVNDIEIFGASAGDGGNGGAGAEGQPGGLGGESLATEAAPNGGIGGNGARGGHSSGAGGGAGGHVIGVLAKGGTATADGIELLGGAPGTGGAGGSAPLSTLRGADGSSGCRVTVYSCVLSSGCGDPCAGD